MVPVKLYYGLYQPDSENLLGGEQREKSGIFQECFSVSSYIITHSNKCFGFYLIMQMREPFPVFIIWVIFICTLAVFLRGKA